MERKKQVRYVQSRYLQDATNYKSNHQPNTITKTTSTKSSSPSIPSHNSTHSLKKPTTFSSSSSNNKKSNSIDHPQNTMPKRSLTSSSTTSSSNTTNAVDRINSTIQRPFCLRKPLSTSNIETGLRKSSSTSSSSNSIISIFAAGTTTSDEKNFPVHVTVRDQSFNSLNADVNTKGSLGLHNLSNNFGVREHTSSGNRTAALKTSVGTGGASSNSSFNDISRNKREARIMSILNEKKALLEKTKVKKNSETVEKKQTLLDKKSGLSCSLTSSSKPASSSLRKQNMTPTSALANHLSEEISILTSRLLQLKFLGTSFHPVYESRKCELQDNIIDIFDQIKSKRNQALQKYLVYLKSQEQHKLLKRLLQQLPALKSLESNLKVSQDGLKRFQTILKYSADRVLLDDVYIGDEVDGRELKHALWTLASEQLNVFEKHAFVLDEIRNCSIQMDQIQEQIEKCQSKLQDCVDREEELDDILTIEKSLAIQLIQQNRINIKLFD